MKFTLIIIIALFISGTASARSRGILIEFVAHQPDAPTVNIYSGVETEQSTGISIAEAASILNKAKHWGSGVSIYILSETFVETKDLLVILGGMKDHPFLEVSYVELGSQSETSKQLLEKYKALPVTKVSSP